MRAIFLVLLVLFGFGLAFLIGLGLMTADGLLGGGMPFGFAAGAEEPMEINGPDAFGKPMKLSDHRGKVVVVIFGALW